MLLFRSEEHVSAWSERRGAPPGATLTLEQGWRLARAWFHDRLSPEWRRKTPKETEEVFAGIGLTGPFWKLT
jgi:alkylmercury lyase-like protein